MPDSHLQTRIAALGLIAALVLLVAGCGGSSDTTTGATTSTSAEKPTKSAGTQGSPRKDKASSKSGATKKQPAADGSSRDGAGAGKPNPSSTPQTNQHKKPTAKKKTMPQGVSQNSHEAGSSPQAAEAEPQGKTHSGSRSPTPQAESGSGGH